MSGILFTLVRAGLPMLTIFIFACGGPSEQEMTEQIREVLNSQVEAWNKGDLEGFMTGYFKSPALSFASRGSVKRGWETIIEGYESRYGKNDMGGLSFLDLETYPLSREAAYVIGRWSLEMEDETLGGIFTLIFRHTASGWRIVHDHTSSATPSAE